MATAELTIDAETREMLEDQVKKGKARKFILIYKGAQIKKLIVFKKGPYSTRIQKAKKEGFRGDAVTGIVTGSGVNLSFQLAGSAAVAGAMGCEVSDKEPTKVAKLRDFLAQSNLKRKPSYEVVKSVSQLRNPDGDNDNADAPQGPAAADQKGAGAKVRTVPGGGGYEYEQHADGSIVIVNSPRRGKKRTPVKKGSKAYNAILAEIGPFPTETTQRPRNGTDEASNVLDELFDAVNDGATGLLGDAGSALGDAIDSLGDAARNVANALGLSEEGDAAPDVMGGAETETEKKLAEFTQSMSNIVVMVDGQPVKVRPPYHWNREGHRIRTDAEKARKENPKVNRLLRKVFKGQFGKGSKTGKATPEQMHTFLQAAIDAKLVPDTTAKGLKDFLDEYGVSTDCSGLAVQALNFLNDGDMSRSGDEEISASNTNTTKISKYPKVKKPSDLQAGDTMVKGGAHVRIITDVDIETDGVYFTTLESTTANVSEHGKGVGERRWRFPDASEFANLEYEKAGKFKKAGAREQSYIYTRHESMSA